MGVALESGSGWILEEFWGTWKKILDCLKQTLSRNMDIKDVAGGDAVGDKEHITGN